MTNHSFRIKKWKWAPNSERGGSFTVSGYLALTLLALCALEAAYVGHLLRHRNIVINFCVQTLPPSTKTHGLQHYLLDPHLAIIRA